MIFLMKSEAADVSATVVFAHENRALPHIVIGGLSRELAYCACDKEQGGGSNGVHFSCTIRSRLRSTYG
jgi:hypothetical protein